MKLGPFRLSDYDKEMQGVYVGDARILGAQVPDGSVDMIFTDPPWDSDSLILYEWVAQWAKRILRPGGFLVAYSGQFGLMQTLRAFEAVGLEYFSLFSGVQFDNNDRQHHKHIFNQWRPIPVFSQGAAKSPRYVPNALRTNRDKRYHPWGQGERAPMRWIDCMTKPGAIIIDPFCGGGCTAAVCKKLERNWLTFELDPDVALIARARLQGINPMPLAEIDQLEMFAGE